MTHERTLLILLPLAILAAIAAAPATAPAQVPPAGARPLPSFTVVSPAGQETPSANLTPEARWVLLYVKPGAAASSKLIAALAGWQLPPESSRRLVLIVEGPVGKAASYLAGLGDGAANAVSWYADADGRAANALGITGAVALRGVRGGAIEWSLDGVLNDPSAFESVVRAWIEAAPVAW